MLDSEIRRFHAQFSRHLLPEGKSVVNLAHNIAQVNFSRQIDTFHLGLALLNHNDPRVAIPLSRAGLTTGFLEEKLNAEIPDPSTPPPPKGAEEFFNRLLGPSRTYIELVNGILRIVPPSINNKVKPTIGSVDLLRELMHGETIDLFLELTAISYDIEDIDRRRQILWSAVGESPEEPPSTTEKSA